MRELEAGTNPRASESRPGDDNYEENDSIATAYDITGLRNVLMNSALSTSYGLVTLQDDEDLFKFTPPDTSKPFDVEIWMDPGLDGGLAQVNSAGNLASAGNIIQAEVLENDILYGLIRVSTPNSDPYYIDIFINDVDEFNDKESAGTYAIRWSQAD